MASHTNLKEIVDHLNDLLVSKCETDKECEELIYFTYEYCYYVEYIKYNGKILFDSDNDDSYPDEEENKFKQWIEVKSGRTKVIEHIFKELQEQEKNYSLSLKVLNYSLSLKILREELYFGK